jgi:hypothetical protein
MTKLCFCPDCGRPAAVSGIIDWLDWDTDEPVLGETEDEIYVDDDELEELYASPESVAPTSASPVVAKEKVGQRGSALLVETVNG